MQCPSIFSSRAPGLSLSLCSACPLSAPPPGGMSVPADDVITAAVAWPPLHLHIHLCQSLSATVTVFISLRRGAAGLGGTLYTASYSCLSARLLTLPHIRLITQINSKLQCFSDCAKNPSFCASLAGNI